MLYVKMQDGKAVAASTEYPGNEARSAYECRCDWPTMERAEQIARELNEATPRPGERLYIAIDNSPNVSPRYDVIDRPMVGDEVSYSFNGDTYPDGKIAKLSATGNLK